ncbi:hypothetical protein JIN84_05800 [Luteolibacter yonseiensis]|uniref:Uncharacterized protein n=1 Tax=Luteolibacter yonseiensis TaxID=1144680 RepID=A0A934R438_9BACT|nr:hypothetical protein [Luteolibacter yonseiensis]MBK1815115.1 hypothetical protein [Luteolibacter yonseiensis]
MKQGVKKLVAIWAVLMAVRIACVWLTDHDFFWDAGPEVDLARWRAGAGLFMRLIDLANLFLSYRVIAWQPREKPVFILGMVMGVISYSPYLPKALDSMLDNLRIVLGL